MAGPGKSLYDGMMAIKAISPDTAQRQEIKLKHKVHPLLLWIYFFANLVRPTGVLAQSQGPGHSQSSQPQFIWPRLP